MTEYATDTLRKRIPVFADSFIQAVHGRKKVRITFFSKEDGHEPTRKYAPMDFGPSGRAKNKINRFHAWDYESDPCDIHSLLTLGKSSR